MSDLDDRNEHRKKKHFRVQIYDHFLGCHDELGLVITHDQIQYFDIPLTLQEAQKVKERIDQYLFKLCLKTQSASKSS